MPKPIDPDLPLTPLILSRAASILPAVCVALACAGWVLFVGAFLGSDFAAVAALSLFVGGAMLVAYGPRFNRPVEGEGVEDRAAGRGEGM